jgi:ribonuclease VapC
MVLTGRSRRLASGRVNDFMDTFRIEVVAVDRTLAETAVQAFDRYGKGRNRAGLSLADCFSYALAKARNVPLLFKGEDFAQTDVVLAWRP